MNIVFLDFDGVLNTNDSLRGELRIHADKIRNFYYLIDQTNAEVVISSSWRYDDDLYLNAMKIACNEFDPNKFYYIKNRIIGTTPHIDSCNRELEVLHYVYENDVKNFIAIDDNPNWNNIHNIFPNNPDWLIETNPNIGFNLIQLKLAIKKLMK